MSKALEYFDDMVESNQLDYGDEKPKCDLIRNQLLDIKCLKIIEQELGCPLEVLFKALKGELYDVNGDCFAVNPFIVFFNNEVVFDFFDGEIIYLKDYKITWWLKEDKSE